MTVADRPINILVEPSDYVLLNIGDMAMLYVATERLAELWPGSIINVLTSEPDKLRDFCPAATPLPADGRNLWVDTDFVPGRLQRLVPESWRGPLRQQFPKLAARLMRLKLRRSPDRIIALDRFLRKVEEADLVLVSGMGGITDYFPAYALGIFETLNLALSKRNRPAVMVGQGMGPLCTPALRQRANSVLPRLDLIALRERRASAPLLAALGVPAERVIATGDDAIEMAHRLRREELGGGIGVNLRLSDYSGVDNSVLEKLRGRFASLSRSLNAPLVPVPVSQGRAEADIHAIRALIPGAEEELLAALAIRTPPQLIRQIQRCRVVVTGSYHAGVFALANGIPTIGLAKSSYYVDKFEGLADMFGIGCETVLLDMDNYSDALGEAVSRLWQAAPTIRPAILARAEAQIADGRDAYRRIHDLVMSRRRAGSADNGLL